MFLQYGFLDISGLFNFSPKMTILHRLELLDGLQLLQEGLFLLSHLSNIWCFFERSFAQNNAIIFKNGFWHVFCIFLPKMTMLQKSIAFAWAVSFAISPIFKIASFLENLVFFQSDFYIFKIVSLLEFFMFFLAFFFFAQNKINVLVECFLHNFGIFHFKPKLSIVQRLQPLQVGRFSTLPHFSNVQRFFFSAVICTEQL